PVSASAENESKTEGLSIVTTAVTAAGAPARPTTEQDRFAPWPTATRASFPSSCRNQCILTASSSSVCAKTLRALANFGAVWDFESAIRYLGHATYRPCSTGSNFLRGVCKAARKPSPGRSRGWKNTAQKKSFTRVRVIHWNPATRSSWKLVVAVVTVLPPNGRANSLSATCAVVTFQWKQRSGITA